MGDHDCPRDSGLYAPGDFTMCNLLHKGTNMEGDTGDRSILCWQLYNFLLEKVIKKNKCTQEAATTGRVATPQEKRQCLSLKVPAPSPPRDNTEPTALLDITSGTEATQRRLITFGWKTHPADPSWSTVLSFFLKGKKQRRKHPHGNRTSPPGHGEHNSSHVCSK